MKMYEENDLVIHKIFGKGKVLRTYENENGRKVAVVKFDELDTHRSIYFEFLGMKKLED
jgi:hypothetical protein